MESTDLAELERTLGQEDRERLRLSGEIARTETQLTGLEGQLRDVDRERASVDRKNEKVRSGLMKETAAKDVLEVIKTTMSVLQGETIDEVSSKMNEIFLSMIIADEDVGSVVRGVALTRDHDIVVFGPGGRTIDPDIDLNGASRRALTLAFILALVQVSGVKAPNIIDTPLGMMGVEVRQSVLKYAAMHSSQLVMFLTGSEILGVEELLDEYAGRIYTFTNATHYPAKLVNEPNTDKTETLVCDCDHRHSCDLCRRRTSYAVQSEAAR
jgi:DNA sulfur modification protein DndD